MKTTFFKLHYPLFFILYFWACEPQQEAQTNLTSLPPNVVNLSTMDDFRSPEGNNWQLAGNLYADRNTRHHLEVSAGEGVLANIPDEQNRSDLYSDFEHADLYLETNFMMPRGSNSGIYFQGRYEVQLLDSWGKDSLTFGDCGAIYQRWDDAAKSGYEGYPPRINASLAPGLWQHLEVKFQAPRFDENGQKISNARFIEVYLNGSLVQQNIEVSGPTRSAFFDEEAPLGPLVIQGDHGPVAFKNMKYKQYTLDRVSLADMEYRLYQGEFQDFDTLGSLQADKSGTTDSLTYQAAGDYDRYAIRFQGVLNAPAEGTYLFRLAGFGPAQLEIDDELITDNEMAQHIRDSGSGSIQLAEGGHPFTLTFIKNNRPWQKGLSLVYEGPGIPENQLHAANSVPEPAQIEPIRILANDDVAIQRGFFMHKGKKYTHTILVGTPHKINYSHEMKSGALLAGWRGDFADATDMWHSRGTNQLARPLGSHVEFSARPLMAQLASSEEPWPDSLSLEDDAFRYKGYELSASGLPTYLYQLQGAMVRDRIFPDTAQHSLMREIQVQFEKPLNQTYSLLAEGKQIEELPDGSYAIDDKSYYLKPGEMGDNSPVIKTEGERQLLLLPLEASASPLNIQYSIIW